MLNENFVTRINSLSVSDGARRDLQEFVSQIVEFYKGDLLSVMLFGSVVTGDYVENTSDINVMVVYSDLNIANLDSVAGFAKKWFAKRNISPRFISKRNLASSAPYFQIDMLEMKDGYSVLYGDDLLREIVIDPKKLHWQLSYEIKAMRMRIKQQFWSSTGDATRIRRILLERFTSLIHLSRTLLFLKKKNVSVSHREVMKTACDTFGISRDFVEMMFDLKNNRIQLDKARSVKAFTDLMEVIRIIDNNVDGVISQGEAL